MRRITAPRRLADGPLAARLRPHLERGKKEGFARTARDDVLRLRDTLRSRRWGRRHRLAPHAVPVFIVGIQRSGTEMLVDAFRRCPEIQVYNESRSSPAFRDFSLREDAVVKGLVERSDHRCVVFKSLCDSHRVPHLLTDLGTPSSGRAVWSFRSMEGRVRSVLAVWPENNRRVLREIALQGPTGHWEAGGLSEGRLELIRSFDYERLSQASAAALLWFLRNELFFELGLDQRADVALSSYEETLASPTAGIRALCEFLGVSYANRMAEHIAGRPPATRGSLEIDPVIHDLCAELEARFEAALEARGTTPLVP
ncbi:MAG TPA: hypothetical protein VE693_01865 [Gaiellaceae bacterium]|jgi:PAS domain-containing protein|nr:hypothetical protein [Gaiellaceae bacterium]